MTRLFDHLRLDRLRLTVAMRVLLLTVLLLGAGPVVAQPAAPSAAEPDMAASVAERIYTAARPRLLQVRTLVAAAGRQSSIGSGFLVSADGLAITNYHVVSQYALEPRTYRLEYAAADGSRGELKLLAIDLANDLALVRLDHGGQPFFQFDARAVNGSLPKGERLYSMGNPLDLGFTIVDGTYNGLVERSYNERIHFSGALNPGMSGGPAVTAEGTIVGVNVARQLGSELVSFLVPGRFAAALLAQAQEVESKPTAPKDFRAEIGRQFTVWQAGLYNSLAGMDFRSTVFGRYRAPESAAPWFTCWAQTNADKIPKPRATVNTTNCNGDTRLFVASDLSTGLVYHTHSYVRSSELNQFQFAAFLSRLNQPSWSGEWSRKWFTQQYCKADFVAAAGRPALRIIWCARAYREFEGLYDVWVMTVTQDSGNEALVSRLSLQGVAYDNAMTLTKRFIEAIQWAK